MNEDRVMAIVLLNALIGALIAVPSLLLGLFIFPTSEILMHTAIIGSLIMASGAVFAVLYFLPPLPTALKKLWRVVIGKDEELY